MTTPPNMDQTYGTAPPPGNGAYGQLQPEKKSNTLKIVLSVLGVLALLFVLLIGSVVYFVFAALKDSEATTTAVRTAESDPAVQAALGSTLTVGTLVSGSTNDKNGEGTAHLEIPVTGSKGAGTIYADEVKASGGPWKITMLEVQPKDGSAPRIQVVEGAKAPGTPEAPPA